MAPARPTRKRKGHSKKQTGTPSKSENIKTDHSPTIRSLDDERKDFINHTMLKKGIEEDGLADVIMIKFKTYKKFFHKGCNEKFDSNKNIVIKIYTDKNLEYEYSINPTAQLEGPSETRGVDKFKKFVKDFIFEEEVKLTRKLRIGTKEFQTPHK